MRARLTAEAVGTFTLVFIAAGAATVNEITNGTSTRMGVSMAFGLVVMAALFGGPIAGCS